MIALCILMKISFRYKAKFIKQNVKKFVITEVHILIMEQKKN